MKSAEHRALRTEDRGLRHPRRGHRPAAAGGVAVTGAVMPRSRRHGRRASRAQSAASGCSAVGAVGPRRVTIATAGEGLRLAVPGWVARATAISSVAPVFRHGEVPSPPHGPKLRMRDIETIDAELRLLARVWRVARELCDRMPST